MNILGATRPPLGRGSLSSAALMAAALACGETSYVVCRAQQSSPYDENREQLDDDGPTRSAFRMREGTLLVNQTGVFRQNGETLTFIDSNKRKLVALPNLNLERVLRLLKTVDEPDSVVWTVSGSVTEFSNQNYLLITRAVYKAVAAPAAAPPPTK